MDTYWVSPATGKGPLWVVKMANGDSKGVHKEYWTLRTTFAKDFFLFEERQSDGGYRIVSDQS